MLGTVLVIGFIVASFVAAAALFATCVTVGRVSKEYEFAEAAFAPSSPTVKIAPKAQRTAPPDAEWRWAEDGSRPPEYAQAAN